MSSARRLKITTTLSLTDWRPGIRDQGAGTAPLPLSLANPSFSPSSRGSWEPCRSLAVAVPSGLASIYLCASLCRSAPL